MARSLRAWAIGVFLVGIFAPALSAQSVATRVVPMEPELYDNIYNWYDGTFPGTYRKEPDGSLQRVEMSYDPAAMTNVWLPVRSLRPVAIADQRGQAVPQSSTLLDAYMPGGKVRGLSALPVYKGKNLLLVFSRESLASFVAMEGMQRQVGEWGAVQKEPATRAAAEAFSRLPLKKSFTAGLAATLRRTFATITIADDLGALGAAYDHALILDFGFSENTLKFLAGFTLQKNGGMNQPPALYSKHVSWILLDGARDVVASTFRVAAPDDAIGSGAELINDIGTRIKATLENEAQSDLRMTLAHWPAAPRPAASPNVALLPGEVLARTAQGCGIIIDGSLSTPSQREIYVEMISKMSWYYVPATGSCSTGLATGTGWLITQADWEKNNADRKVFEAQQRADAEADRQAVARGETPFPRFDSFLNAAATSEFAFGRDMNKMGLDFGTSGSIIYTTKNATVSIPMLPDPYAPVWEGVNTTSLTSPGGTTVSTAKEMCDSSEKACADKSYDIYGVRVTNKANRSGLVTWCSNKRSPSGCEALWQEKAGPVIASLKAVLADYAAETARRKQEISALNTQWAADRAAAQKAASELEAIKFGLRLEAAAVNGPGALFALADAMAAAKKPSESRQALIALVARYSSQPLGLVAAKRLAAMTK